MHFLLVALFSCAVTLVQSANVAGTKSSEGSLYERAAFGNTTRNATVLRLSQTNFNPVTFRIPEGSGVRLRARSFASFEQLIKITLSNGHDGVSFFGSGENVPMSVRPISETGGFKIPPQGAEYSITALFRFNDGVHGFQNSVVQKEPIVQVESSSSITSEDSVDNDNNDSVLSVFLAF